MRAVMTLSLLGLCLTGCATLPGTARTPYLPAGVYGTYEDNDRGAINQSAWAFASAAHTRGNPIDAAKAVVALEYLSGELRENPRWVGLDPSVAPRLGLARNELRQVLGIREDAPSQAVVNALLAVSQDLQFGNRAAAMQALASPVFTQSPERTLQVLSNLPYVQQANLATARAEDESIRTAGMSG
jgi:hypothetical protein